MATFKAAGVKGPMPPDEFEGQLANHGDMFVSQAGAIRDLRQFATDADERRLDVETAREGLSQSQRAAVREGMVSVATALKSAADAADAGESKEFSVNFDPGDPAVERAIGRMFVRTFHQFRMPSRKLLLKRAVLLLAVSDFELLVGEVMRAVLLDQPGKAGLGDASISLTELEQIANVEEAKRVIVDRKVDDLLRKSMDEWATWFDRIGVNLKDIPDEWPSFIEIFARRNVVVHAGGRVTEQYLSVLRSAGLRDTELPELGTNLKLDDTYLDASSEHLLSCGVLLVAGTWLQLRKRNSKKAERWIVSRTEQLLELEHFRAVRTISSTVLERSRGRLRREIELALRTMSWVARRELGDVESVQKEVREWDSSGIDLKYAHARAVLLDDDDMSVRQINELVERKSLTAVELVASPMYRDLIARRRADLLPDIAAHGQLSIATSAIKPKDSAGAGETLGSPAEAFPSDEESRDHGAVDTELHTTD
ncbi:hypothetical protein H7J86_00605 [Mycobacterium hackensackense]|uniref:hypothetical protein n=1 Tax=Mycobacterium hackensackense TaxID=228909 RepID=UPI002265A7D4|nr:hypothetical protein [Mycobacterium hackensackense]MCV7250660.1 hypothetical protein [Mycobacterium hackensackense]